VRAAACGAMLCRSSSLHERAYGDGQGCSNPGVARVPRPRGDDRKTAELLAKAAAEGARLAVLPEGFVPGYPDWVWRATPWDDHHWFARW